MRFLVSTTSFVLGSTLGRYRDRLWRDDSSAGTTVSLLQVSLGCFQCARSSRRGSQACSNAICRRQSGQRTASQDLSRRFYALFRSRREGCVRRPDEDRLARCSLHSQSLGCPPGPPPLGGINLEHVSESSDSGI